MITMAYKNNQRWDATVPLLPELAMPRQLSVLGRHIWLEIVMTAHELQCCGCGGCKAFYSPQEWRSRGESYGHNAELVVVYDGSALGLLFSLDKDEPHYKNVNAMAANLKQLGCYSEEQTCWYSAVYRC